MARFSDLPSEVHLTILELVFLETVLTMQYFDGIVLDVRRPPPALLHTCRAFYELGKFRIHQLTTVEIRRREAPRSAKHWNCAARLLKHCPDGAKALTLRSFQDRLVIKKICANMKSLQSIRWVTGSRHTLRSPPLPANTPPTDILAILRRDAKFMSHLKWHAGLVGNVASLELVFNVIRDANCKDNPTVTHRLEGQFTLQLGATKGFFRSADDMMWDHGEDCRCVKKFTTAW